MNTKVEDNFVEHNLDTEFALFELWTWEISCKERPMAHQGHKYNPLGAPRWLPIDIHSSESCRRSPQGGGHRGLAAEPPELENDKD
jgi:hypothetical protein